LPCPPPLFPFLHHPSATSLPKKTSFFGSIGRLRNGAKTERQATDRARKRKAGYGQGKGSEKQATDKAGFFYLPATPEAVLAALSPPPCFWHYRSPSFIGC
jgi:hypothetical protein